jgi:hypothetical protein
MIRVINTTPAAKNGTSCVLPTPTSGTTGQMLIVRNDTLGQLNFVYGSTPTVIKNAAQTPAPVTAAKQTSVVFINDGTPAWVYFGKLSV